MASEMRIGSVYIGRTLEEVRNKNSEFNKFTKRFSDYTCRNSLQYVAEPYRSDDFELQNEDINTGLVPEVSFTFNAINEEVYRTFIQIVNSKGFFVAYYDYELGVDVIRKVYMSEKDLQRVQFAPPNSKMQDGTISQLGYIQRLIGLTVTFVSKYGYADYNALLESASYDPRFAWNELIETQENYLLYGKDLSGNIMWETVGLNYTFEYDNNSKKVLFNVKSEFNTDNKEKHTEENLGYVWYATTTNDSRLIAYTDKTIDNDGNIYATKKVYEARDYIF